MAGRLKARLPHLSQQSPDSIRGRTSGLLASCQKEPPILPTAPMAFPVGPERLAATAACASLPPLPRCRVSCIGAGSDRNGAARPRPGSPSRRRGTELADYAPSAADCSLTPLAAAVPGPRRQSDQGSQGLAVPPAQFGQKGHQGGRSERSWTGYCTTATC